MNKPLAFIIAAASLTVSASVLAHDHGEEKPNIIETAAAAGDFSTLLTAIEAAGLTETLAGEGPFTVFAPTDAAFGAIPEADLAAILADTETLTAILTYHVVSGKVTSAEVVTLDNATSLQGSDITITVANGSVLVDQANVITVDIEAGNGIIHVIDAVITP